MKNKTKNKLERKWQNLPLHHIDACIVMEVLMVGDNCEYCENYLNNVGYKYGGVLSISVFGEIFKSLITKFEKEIDR